MTNIYTTHNTYPSNSILPNFSTLPRKFPSHNMPSKNTHHHHKGEFLTYRALLPIKLRDKPEVLTNIEAKTEIASSTNPLLKHQNLSSLGLMETILWNG